MVDTAQSQVTQLSPDLVPK